MKKALLAAFAVAALAFAPSAFAANTGTFSVWHEPMVLAGSASTTMHLSFPQSDDPIAAMNIFTGSGYGVTLSQPVGTTIGTAKASVLARTPNLVLPLEGNVVVANPSQYTAQSTVCAGTPTSQAVWAMNLSVAGTPLTILVFVNPTVGAQQALGAYRITVCFTPYDVPESQGGAPQGAQLLDVLFTVNGIFTTPASGGLIKWETLVTPYTPKAGTANPAGTFEMRAFVPLPIILGLSKSYNAKTNVWRVTGSVSEGGKAVAGLTVRIARGVTKTRLLQRTTAKTSATGAYSATGRLSPKKTTYFQVSASVAERDYTAEGCASPLTAVAPAGCVSARLSPWSRTSSIVVIKLK